ncbi:flavohemoglobin expression-modulating QEGLA motif protein [Pseudomonas sp. GD03860]|uniref:tyrosine/phenylalanine carboxypeptidase domain-containing protein n=1 Tax=Pseudomonas TaxID=286 RepID=UPI0023645EC7|nr:MULTISPECIES: tyrosine/phenylalanine carboxypeptidase domain-containing protein [Pseudomonas]MDD2056486.1 flavohemoglobin expression-modulating QEGLA motif protein [Pseudomonas putida]MDH0640484.1 flavohemoglobin expression-modulating QEGLA motif protein [Pseudomonas sp. GD03860]
MSLASLSELDAALPGLARRIRVLDALSWPEGVEDVFLANWRAGKAQLPDVEQCPRDHSGDIAALEAFIGRCDVSHPAGHFLAMTARSYATAARMLGAIGTPAFTQYCAALYRRPDFYYPRQQLSMLDAARFFLQTTDALLGGSRIPPSEATIPAKDFAAWMQPELDRFFGVGQISVRLDPTLAAKAIAGSSRIRLRASALFSELDKNQLLQHEAFVHVATAQNGALQPNLKCLGLGAPRTTQTQEGIATLAELFTASMDINRLRRLALRVLAVQQALDGADFIQVFEGFLAAGQSEEESFRSTQRIFRGADLRGGSAFTKDAAYLTGLLGVHTLMRIAIRDNRPELVGRLFAGRLSLSDTVRLGPLFESGWLKGPVHVPAWASDLRLLAANLAFSAFIARIKLEVLDLEMFMAFADEHEADASAR